MGQIGEAEHAVELKKLHTDTAQVSQESEQALLVLDHDLIARSKFMSHL
ncbi:hypothetical protein RSal33209_0338 [Renibacterium salmoninarum ATCC 33209]|uniref:Uncharacterized protein n=1 Tax=Renibacterium salmoninarum (strain ATCC 33209 / DSM 20767 / JCM 11484 / NBRC 15589 / NCIMB 2235) TaxID=288705 RepID=A9WKT6_RENSM|nr:hypothetical protein RSal33209_0338 [Renibacterium salmoninarum ATCC 33209]